MPVQSRDHGSILWNHYLWCRREGRDTSWFHQPQATSDKLQATSDKLHAINSQRFVDNAKPQASSGASSNKR